jgi:hypothetical protein
MARSTLALTAAALFAVACTVANAITLTAPVVHASVTLAPEHVLQFVEFKPGITGVVETGRVMLDTPAVADNLKSLSWVDLYRRFAGSEKEVPASMLDAQARANARARANAQAPSTRAPAPAEAGQDSGGEGPHFYNADEQAWFKSTFCNGAQNCDQGWDWTLMTSKWPIGSGTGIAGVGSEGTTTATFSAYYWWCTGWNLFIGDVCDWFYFWQGSVLPGYWISMNVSGGPLYCQWHLDGAGRNTQVSTAAHY